jgi:hypothetical protein
MSKITALERETIILFNEAEKTAEIETYNPAMKKRLEIIRREHPEDISLVRRESHANIYVFPKKWVKIVPPRRLSEKQREQLAKHAFKR